jgi:hypothetical protein
MLVAKFSLLIFITVLTNRIAYSCNHQLRRNSLLPDRTGIPMTKQHNDCEMTFGELDAVTRGDDGKTYFGSMDLSVNMNNAVGSAVGSVLAWGAAGVTAVANAGKAVVTTDKC